MIQNYLTFKNIKLKTLNEEDLVKKASLKALEKIKSKLGSKEYISDYKILSKSVSDDSITLNIFLSVVEDVTDYVDIEKYNQDNNT